MSELKTRENDASVETFIQSVEDELRRADCRTLVSMLERVTGKTPRMWGKNMVGFGSYHYVYKSGREGDWFVIGFSPRKQDLTVYIMPGFDDYAAQLGKLGKHRTGKSCLYLKKLQDIDLRVLEDIARSSVDKMHARYRCD